MKLTKLTTLISIIILLAACSEDNWFYNGELGDCPWCENGLLEDLRDCPHCDNGILTKTQYCGSCYENVLGVMGFVESGCLGQMGTTILKIANRAMVM